jgi:hypothetical protein
MALRMPMQLKPHPNEPGIGVYNPDGGSMGLPVEGDLQECLERAGRYMKKLSEENENQPTKLCLTLPEGVHVFTVGDWVEFKLWQKGDKEFEPTGERVMYFTYDPKKP